MREPYSGTLADCAAGLETSLKEARAEYAATEATVAAYREALERIVALEAWSAQIDVEADDWMYCPICDRKDEIAAAALSSPDPAASVTAKLAAVEGLADAARVWAKISLNWSFQRPDRVDALLDADKAICAAVAAYDKLVRP